MPAKVVKSLSVNGKPVKINGDTQPLIDMLSNSPTSVNSVKACKLLSGVNIPAKTEIKLVFDNNATVTATGQQIMERVKYTLSNIAPLKANVTAVKLSAPAFDITGDMSTRRGRKAKSHDFSFLTK